MDAPLFLVFTVLLFSANLSSQLILQDPSLEASQDSRTAVSGETVENTSVANTIVANTTVANIIVANTTIANTIVENTTVADTTVAAIVDENETANRNCTTARGLSGLCVKRGDCNFSTAAIDLTLFAPRGFKRPCTVVEVCCPFEALAAEVPQSTKPAADASDRNTFEFDDDD